MKMDRLDPRHKSSVESIRGYEYDSKERLGFGAFAIVFKGWLKENPSVEVAVKVVAKKNLQKSQALLDKEIKILQEITKLHHENVVALLDCIPIDTNVYLVMEYCNGGDLQDYLNVQKSLSENTIRLFTRQLAAAMKALWEKGVLHRDLKPQNILLKFDPKLCPRDRKGARIYPRPEDISLKIADFGFARFLSEGVMAATMCGSPMYMAPEVIMSMKYDAKADLWSLGTIIYQCLVGSAPFCATTPAGLKQIYEKHQNLTPQFPEGISSDLKDLLLRLLKRNSNERISFDDFFNHPFLKKTASPLRPRPLPSPPRDIADTNIYLDLQDKRKPACESEASKCNQTETFNDKLSFNNCISSETSDDFVLVPSNLPTDRQCRDMPSSPPRPSTLPIQIPRSNASPKKVIDQKSSPIGDRWNNYATNINSISPSPVQFILGGTPPSNRRPPESPPGMCFNCSGGSVNNNKNWAITPTNSPLKRSVVSSPLLSSPFGLFNSSNSFAAKAAFNSRAVTLPEIKNVGAAMGLIFPELNEGKLFQFQREHREILTKLNFVMVLIECILECANPSRERNERLVLLVRALQLISCGLTLATNELKSGHLQPSTNVKNVVRQLNEKFYTCFEDCKKLNTPSVLEKVSTSAEKLLFDYAIEMCQKAALCELQNDISECFKRYQVAQIILHSLTQQAFDNEDKSLIIKYQGAVEKRLNLLQDRQQIIFENNYYRIEDEKNSNEAF